MEIFAGNKTRNVLAKRKTSVLHVEIIYDFFIIAWLEPFGPSKITHEPKLLDVQLQHQHLESNQSRWPPQLSNLSCNSASCTDIDTVVKSLTALQQIQDLKS